MKLPEFSNSSKVLDGQRVWRFRLITANGEASVFCATAIDKLPPFPLDDIRQQLERKINEANPIVT